MSSGSSLPYRLRQNKSVDRELFLGLLGRLAATLKLEDYQYVGLGGPFLEDFRLIHARLGLKDLVCIEAEENVHKRQLFNAAPFASQTAGRCNPRDCGRNALGGRLPGDTGPLRGADGNPRG